MNSITLASNRLAAADILKVYAIFAVVFIHGSYLLPFSPSAVDFSKASVDLAASALRFCVPVFIFLWAYFMEKSILKKGSGIIWSRFYKLLIPYAFWTLIYTIIKADIHCMSLPYVFVKFWTGYGWSGQYYFIILFQFIVLFPVWRWISLKLINSVPLVYILSILFFVFVAYSGWSQNRLVVRTNDRMFIYWWPYVILGIIHAHRNIFRLPIPALACILSLALIPAEYYFFHPDTVSPYALPSVFITSMLLVRFTSSALAYKDIPAHTGSLILRIANYTLGIYCLNPLVIFLIGLVFHPAALQFPGSSVICPLVATGVVCSICIGIIILLNKIRLGFLVSTSSSNTAT